MLLAVFALSLVCPMLFRSRDFCSNDIDSKFAPAYTVVLRFCGWRHTLICIRLQGRLNIADFENDIPEHDANEDAFGFDDEDEEDEDD